MIDRRYVLKRRICLLLLVPPLFVGCGKKAAEKAIERAAAKNGQEVKVKTGKDSMTIEAKDDQGKKVVYKAEGGSATIASEDGSIKMTTGSALKLPEGYPKDAPSYAGMQIDTSALQGDMFMVHGSTSDKPDKVLATLRNSAKTGGWSEETFLEQAGMKMFTGKKGERTLSVMINENDGQTLLTLSVSK